MYVKLNICLYMYYFNKMVKVNIHYCVTYLKIIFLIGTYCTSKYVVETC